MFNPLELAVLKHRLRKEELKDWDELPDDYAYLALQGSYEPYLLLEEILLTQVRRLSALNFDDLHEHPNFLFLTSPELNKLDENWRHTYASVTGRRTTLEPSGNQSLIELMALEGRIREHLGESGDTTRIDDLKRFLIRVNSLLGFLKGKYWTIKTAEERRSLILSPAYALIAHEDEFAQVEGNNVQ